MEVTDEGSLAALEDVVVWTELMSVANVNADDICEELGCESKLLNSVELCGMLAGEGTAELEDKMAVDDNTGCNVKVAEALADNRVVDVATEMTAEVAKEFADVIIVEEAIVEIVAEFVEESGIEVATDSTVEVVDGVTGVEEVVGTVESAAVDKSTVVEVEVGTALDEGTAPEEVTRTVDEAEFAKDDVGTALVGKTTPEDVARTVDKTEVAEDVVGTALEERLSALMMSAAFARALGSYPKKLEEGFHTFSATPYTTACKCAAGITGKIPASTTLRFCVPTQSRSQHAFFKAGIGVIRRLREPKRAFYSPKHVFRTNSVTVREKSLRNIPQTSRCESTTPPCSSGSIANVPLGWNSVRIPLLIT